MKKIIVALSLIVSAAAVWAQPARTPVNDMNTGCNKPNSNTPTTNSELKKYSDPQGRFSLAIPASALLFL